MDVVVELYFIMFPARIEMVYIFVYFNIAGAYYVTVVAEEWNVVAVSK